MYQQGNFPLTEGQLTYNVSFSLEFPNTDPSLILTNVFNAVNQDPQLTLVGNITSRDQEGFTFELSTAPDSNNYVLSWMASDGLESNGITMVQTNGIPVADFPKYNNPILPDNTLFPAILTNGPKKSIAVTWGNLKNFLVKAHTHLVEEISNISLFAKEFLTANDEEAARESISAAAIEHTHVADDISDATSIGKSLMTANTQADARTTIAAAASSHTHNPVDITAAVHVGTFLSSTSMAAARNAITAANAVHTHVINDITNSGAVGKLVMEAADTSTALSAIKAMPESGWRDGGAIIASRNLSDADYGKKFSSGINPFTIHIPTGLSGRFKVAFTVTVDDFIIFTIASGVTIRNYRYGLISGPITLKQGFYILENISLSDYVLLGYETSFQRSVSAAEDADGLKDLLNLSVDDFSAVTTLGNSVLTVEDSPSLNKLANTSTWRTVLTTINALSLTSVAGYTFEVNAATISVIDVATNLENGESYWIKNTSSSAILRVRHNSPGFINSSGNNSVGVDPFGIIEVRRKTTNEFEVDYVTTNGLDSRTIYVSQTGDDFLGQRGNPERPFRTISAALSLTNANCNTIHVKAGNYSVTTTLSSGLNEINYYFEAGANVTIDNNIACFTLETPDKQVNVYGFGSFSFGTSAKLVEITSTSKFYLKASKITANAATSKLVLSSAANSYVVIDCPIIEARNTVKTIELAGFNTLHLIGQEVVLGSGCVAMGSKTGVRISINNGYLNLVQNLLDNNSNSAATLTLNLVNSHVSHVNNIPATDYLIKFDSSSVRISGVNSSITGNFDGKSLYYTSGKVLLAGVKIVNPIYINGDYLTMDGVSIEVGSAVTYSLLSSGSFDVCILRNCFSNKPFDPTAVSFIGGTLVDDVNFVL